MRVLLWVSRGFIAIAVIGIFVAWYHVWAEHRREVDRVRYVWGPNAKVPMFNPLDLFNFAKMDTGNTANKAIDGYVLAGLSGFFAFLCWLFQWQPARAKKKPSTLPNEPEPHSRPHE